MNSDSESYDSDDYYEEAESSSDSDNSGKSYLSTGSDFFKAFIKWTDEMAEEQRIELGDASIDRLASSLVSSNNFRLRQFSGVKPVADGGGVEDITRWIDDYEDLCAVNGWNDVAKCQKLPAFLTAGARDYFREEIRGKDIANNWAQLKEAITKFYQPVDYTTQALETLSRRSQRPMEPVQAYILEMKRLAKLVNEDMPAEELKFWVLKGIHPQIRVCLLRRDLPDLVTLMTEARRVEKSIAAESPSNASSCWQL